MKKSLVMICALVAIMVSCNKEQSTSDETADKVSFNLSAIYPGESTKAVKTGWETDDVIFVFFSEQVAPAYLEMKWDGTQWLYTEKNTLALSNGETGTMRAMFLPFGSNATVSTSGFDYTFSLPINSYYLTSELDYTVVDGEVTGTFAMQIPAGYVQFYIADALAEDGKAYLWESHVTPAHIDYISDDMKLVYRSGTEEPANYPMMGYAYKGGYVFSGVLTSAARNNPVSYSFGYFDGSTVKQANAGTKTMYTSTSTGRAANITGLSWSPVTPAAVDLGLSVKWASLNVGAVVPADYGMSYSWGETMPKCIYDWDSYKYAAGNVERITKYCSASQYGNDGYTDDLTRLVPTDDVATSLLGSIWRIPTKSEWNELCSSANCTWSWKTTANGYSQNGFLVTSKKAGFTDKSIFLPAAGCRTEQNHSDSGVWGYYWASDVHPEYPGYAACADFRKSGASTLYMPRNLGFSIRAVME